MTSFGGLWFVDGAWMTSKVRIFRKSMGGFLKSRDFLKKYGFFLKSRDFLKKYGFFEKVWMNDVIWWSLVRGWRVDDVKSQDFPKKYGFF